MVWGWFRVWGLGFRDDLGLRVSSIVEVMVYGAWLMVHGVCFMVYGSNSPHDLSNRSISKDRNVYPLAQFSQIDGQTIGILGSVRGNLKFNHLVQP